MNDRNKHKSGIALIITLLVIVILTIAVTAFMQSMSLERRTSQAYLNNLRAENAAQAGLQKAILQLDKAIANRRTYVTAAYQPKNADGTVNTNLAPVVVVSSASADTDVFSKPIPVVSRAQADSDFERATANPIPTTVGSGFGTLDTDRLGSNSAVSTVDLNRNKAIQDVAVANFYRVPLEKISVNGKLNIAYGYYAMDEQARIAPAYHRNISRAQSYNYPSDSTDIPLDLGSDSTSTPRLFSSAAAALLPSVNLLQFSPNTIAQICATQADYNRIKHLVGGYQTFSEETIPAGYPSAGKPKYDINDHAKNVSFGATGTARAENFATLIDTELPGFKDRDKAMYDYVGAVPLTGAAASAAKMKYLNRLLATVVDYIDTDSTATLVNSGEPAGRDLFPLVVAVAEKIQRGAISFDGTNYNVTFTTQLYVQVWNPYTTATTATPRFALLNRMRVTFGTGIVTPLSDYDQTAASAATVRPNEMKVLVFPAVTQTFTSSTNSNPTWAAGSPSETADQQTHLYFQFYWGGVLADMNRRPPIYPNVTPGAASAGLTRTAKTFSVTTGSYYCSFVPTNAIAGGGYRFPGDPRANYLSNYDWGNTISADATYASSTRWGGKQTNTQTRWQDYNTTWIARDFVRANANDGGTPGSVNVAPDAVPQTTPYDITTDGKNAPAYIRNDEMRSIGELGHIFDPAQADDSGLAPSGGSPGSVFVSAGARTLRIGQPEFTYWDTETATDAPDIKISKSKRAINLIDILTTNKANAFINTGYPQSKGRININTAPKEVLASLFYNLGLYTDQTGASACVIDYDGAASLAQYIVDNRPFQKISDLRILTRQLLKGYTPSSGAPKKTYYTPEPAYSPYLEPTTNIDTTVNSLALMDRAREEVFNRILNCVTVQSRAYRIFSYGRSYTPAGTVASQTMLEAIVEFEPLPIDPANPTYVRIKPKITYLRTIN